MKIQINIVLILLCLHFAVSCQQKEDCGKCTDEGKVYMYEKPDNHWIKIYQKEEGLYLSFSQNPSEHIPLEEIEYGGHYIITSIKSTQKNAEGGSKIEAQIKIVFQEESLEVSGLSPDEQTLIFRRIKEEGLTQFLPVRKRKVYTKVGQSAFIREKKISKDFYKNLAQVLCYYGVMYEEKEGRIYVSTLRYYEEEELMWNCTRKAHDVQWLKSHACEE
jgi:hypothetical protein